MPGKMMAQKKTMAAMTWSPAPHNTATAWYSVAPESMPPISRVTIGNHCASRNTNTAPSVSAASTSAWRAGLPLCQRYNSCWQRWQLARSQAASGRQ